jgi:hypothetical protein
MAQLHSVLQGFVEVIEQYHREKCSVLDVPEPLAVSEAADSASAEKAAAADLGVESVTLAGAGVVSAVAGAGSAGEPVADLTLTSAKLLRQRLSGLIEAVSVRDTSRTTLLNYCLDAAVQIQEILDGERSADDVNKRISFLTQFMLNMQTLLTVNQAEHSLLVSPDDSAAVKFNGLFSYHGWGLTWGVSGRLIESKLFPAFGLRYQDPDKLFSPIIKGIVNEFCLEKAAKDLTVAGQEIARLNQMVEKLQRERVDFQVKLAASAAALEQRVAEVTTSAAPGMAAPKQGGFFGGGKRGDRRGLLAASVGFSAPAPVTSAAAVDTPTHRGGKGGQRGGGRNSDAVTPALPRSPVVGPR